MQKEVIFPVGRYREVPYFQPPVGFNETESLKHLTGTNLRIAEELRHLPEKLRHPANRISVSFIYALAPDYYGMPMRNAPVSAWQEIFRRFKTMQIDTVIFQAALWKELGECFYRTGHFRDLTAFPVLERMFEAADAEGMHVYLGGYGSVAGWKEHFSPAELAAEMECYRVCFEELYRLGRIDGMYFPSETAFKETRQPKKEQRMKTLYRKFSDIVKNRNPALKIIASPATQHNPADNEMFKDFWNAILDGAGIDILMPQDCIGNGGTCLSYLDSQWKAWKEIADQQKITLWSNTEIFERRGFRPEYNIFPASPERVAAQLALTDPYVSRHCCWEAQYLTSDEAGAEGIRLRKFLQSGRL